MNKLIKDKVNKRTQKLTDEINKLKQQLVRSKMVKNNPRGEINTRASNKNKLQNKPTTNTRSNTNNTKSKLSTPTPIKQNKTNVPKTQN